MRAVKQGLLCALALTASAAAMAGTVHHVRFAQPALILVWEADTLIARGDRIEVSPHAAASGLDIPGAGILQPLTESRGGSMILSVASNTAFSLKTDDSESASTVAVQLLGIRENAQSRPLETPGILFRQDVRTAARRGPPPSQAIELEISWSGDVPPTLVLAAD